MKNQFIVVTNKNNFPIDVHVFNSLSAAENYVRIEKDRIVKLDKATIFASNDGGFISKVDGNDISVIIKMPAN